MRTQIIDQHYPLNRREGSVKSVGQCRQRNGDRALIETDNGLPDAYIQKDEPLGPSCAFCIVRLHHSARMFAVPSDTAIKERTLRSKGNGFVP